MVNIVYFAGSRITKETHIWIYLLTEARRLTLNVTLSHGLLSRTEWKGEMEMAFIPLYLLIGCSVVSCLAVLQHDGLHPQLWVKTNLCFLKLTLSGVSSEQWEKQPTPLHSETRPFPPSSPFCGQPPTWQSLLESFRHCEFSIVKVDINFSSDDFHSLLIFQKVSPPLP